ncbi:MAG: SUMF1/EgtB/PvdO family nonheme iron enzyme [Bacteroidetes bacterium]|nr:SUMF1/EgtB/PvdO family nonheme iron enzyme [Bacteroidota bacterium]
MKRRAFLNKTLINGIGSFVSLRSLESLASLKLQEPSADGIIDSNDIIPAPDNPQLWEEWRNNLSYWRTKKQKQLNYDGSSYRTEAFNWVTTDFACCFVMMCDSDFYDHNKNQYNVRMLIDKGKKEYGGYDSVVLWHAYPRIGLDNRNQFDFYREMPHGLPGLKDVVKQFHNSNIKVFINYNPWDTGTRRENRTDLDLLIEILRATDTDGIFLDTMRNAPDFRGKLDQIRPGIVMEGEIALPLEDVQTHHLSWAQWFKDSYVPGVYRNKWFERNHMQHAIARWDTDKSAQLQTAWMNGSGMLIWENIFGQWLGWNERDKSTYRIMSSIQRYFSDHFSGENWKPLAVESNVKDVFVSQWEKDGITLWTLVNRNDYPVNGVLMKTVYDRKKLWYNMLNGQEIKGRIENGVIEISGSIGGRGIGCFAAMPENKVEKSFMKLLELQKANSSISSSDTITPVIQNVSEVKADQVKHSSVTPGMVVVPASSTELKMEYTFRECGAYGNIQEHLSLAPKHKLHTLCIFNKKVNISRFAIDETPVTNTMFSEFLRATGYKPAIPDNFLKHWNNGQIPADFEDHPVVYVSHEDAKAYVGWAEKRLPSAEEWQLAAQGPEGFSYPWGNKMEENRCNPNTNGTTTSVRAYPDGASPYGCLDMCGNTWELTRDVYSDGRSRFVMLKGGSCFRAEGSVWYMDGGPQKNRFLAKMLLMYPGLDRCSTVGFRCVADL